VAPEARGWRRDRNTNRRMLLLAAMTTNAAVFGRSNSTFAVGGLAIALSLCGCADDTAGWFSKPLNVYNNNRGYSYSSLGESKQDRSIAANDLVDANGACPGYVAPASPPPVAGGPDAGAAPPDQGSALGGGIALGMSECEVVSRLGRATAVDVGQNPNGLRSSALTFKGGPRPGLYRFEAGRLSEMDRVEQPQSTQPENKKAAKKKPAATAVPPKTGDKS
jgi:hypothetical protein